MLGVISLIAAIDALMPQSPLFLNKSCVSFFLLSGRSAADREQFVQGYKLISLHLMPCSQMKAFVHFECILLPIQGRLRGITTNIHMQGYVLFQFASMPRLSKHLWFTLFFCFDCSSHIPVSFELPSPLDHVI